MDLYTVYQSYNYHMRKRHASCLIIHLAYFSSKDKTFHLYSYNKALKQVILRVCLIALHKHSSLLNGLLPHNINVLIINELFSNEIMGFLIIALACLYFL